MPSSNDIVSSAAGTTLVRARRNTDQTALLNNGRTTLIFNVEDWDSEKCWDGTNYTVPTSGLYEIMLACRVLATGTLTSTSELQLSFRTDATTIFTFQRLIYNPGQTIMIASGVYYLFLAKGQICQFQIFCIFPGATALKTDSVILPTSALIRRH